MARKENKEYEPEVQEQEPTEEKRTTAVVYASLYPKSLWISSKTILVKQSDGSHTRERAENPVKIAFRGGLFFLTDDIASSYGMTRDQMQKLIESQSQFRNGEIWRVDDPDEVDAIRAKATAKFRGATVVAGIKAADHVK
jgi:hypothetical protein